MDNTWSMFCIIYSDFHGKSHGQCLSLCCSAAIQRPQLSDPHIHNAVYILGCVRLMLRDLMWGVLNLY